MTKIELHESGRTRGTGAKRRAKLLAADVWGSSAYYPAEVLARDAEAVFVPGTKMYENHFTESEEGERPEGDVSKMVGKLISHGVYEADNPEGPGVYADVEFYPSYVDRINEIGDDVGLSVRGKAASENNEMAGRFGPVVTQLATIHSVDVVTTAGAGGKIVSILESAGPMAGEPIYTEGEQSVTVTKDEFTAGLAELKESIATALAEAITGMTTDLREALKPAAAEVIEPVAETAPAVEPAAEIDHVALATEVAKAELPAEVIPGVVTAVKEGKTIADAVAGQVALREAFKAHAPAVTTVRITESAREPEGSTRDQVLAAFKN